MTTKPEEEPVRMFQPGEKEQVLLSGIRKNYEKIQVIQKT
jgi:hypothetical protein